ncbi:hypothetical protein DV701_11225 [Ornithinimicrobium avium]|uniref:Uncharacterized protein n=1 Tax=Ornithinimicrobium avium TaxID=2283195 RepID=A0A345NNK8_9MICO|nr:hypothetical protein DV701_11225 [Ornithinimicrobium avium]
MRDVLARLLAFVSVVRLGWRVTYYEGISLTSSLTEAGEADAVAVLTAYFSPLSGKDTGFTGGVWDTFDPSGTRAASGNTFTSDDLLACSFLSAPIHPRSAIELVDSQRRRFEVLLEQVGPDLDFVTLASTDVEPFTSVRTLYRALIALPFVGETRATKLLARKRPRLVPIVDSVIKQAVFGGANSQWRPLHAALTAQESLLWNRLLHLRQASGLSECVTPLRIFDVLAWMDGSGNTRRVLEGQSILREAPSQED